MRSISFSFLAVGALAAAQPEIATPALRLRLKIPADTNVKINPTGNGSIDVSAMFTSGFL